jgi:hypothetical protein
MSLKTHKKCIGYIDNKPCPYNALNTNKCRAHTNTMNLYKKNKYKGTCMLCAEFLPIIQYPCKHNYCYTCIYTNEFDDICPVCLSFNECIESN